MKFRNGKNAAGSGVLIMVLLAGLTLAGCSQRENLPLAVENVTTDQHLPFEAASGKGGVSPTGSLLQVAIPAGTPVTIHLKLPLSSASSRAGDPFDAVLEDPFGNWFSMTQPK